MATSSELKKVVVKYLKENCQRYANKDGQTYTIPIEASYDDKLEPKDIESILESDNPMKKLQVILYEGYNEAIWLLEADLLTEMLNCEEYKTLDPDESDEEKMQNILWEHCYFEPDIEHFLRQKVCTNIFINTGDADVDFTSNTHYPAYYGDALGHGYGMPIDERAAIIWLAKAQGYTLEQLCQALDEGNPSGFLQSVREEELNLTSPCNTLVFLVDMELRQLLALNEQMREKASGYLLLDKKAVCGLVNVWNGSGGLLGIQLEHEVKIPFDIIYSAMPDGYVGRYSISSIYGLCDSTYTDTFKGLEAVSVNQSCSV